MVIEKQMKVRMANKRNKLVVEASECESVDEMVAVFRSGWAMGLFIDCLTDFMLEDIANVLNESIDDTARWDAVSAVNGGIKRSIEFQRFHAEVMAAKQ